MGVWLPPASRRTSSRKGLIQKISGEILRTPSGCISLIHSGLDFRAPMFSVSKQVSNVRGSQFYLLPSFSSKQLSQPPLRSDWLCSRCIVNAFQRIFACVASIIFNSRVMMGRQYPPVYDGYWSSIGHIIRWSQCS